jgi:hypothetical protein
MTTRLRQPIFQQTTPKPSARWPIFRIARKSGIEKIIFFWWMCGIFRNQHVVSNGALVNTNHISDSPIAQTLGGQFLYAFAPSTIVPAWRHN